LAIFELDWGVFWARTTPASDFSGGEQITNFGQLFTFLYHAYRKMLFKMVFVRFGGQQKIWAAAAPDSYGYGTSLALGHCTQMLWM